MLIKKHSVAWDSFITQYSGLITEKERKREKKTNTQKPLVAKLMIFFVVIVPKDKLPNSNTCDEGRISSTVIAWTFTRSKIWNFSNFAWINFCEWLRIKNLARIDFRGMPKSEVLRDNLLRISKFYFI